MIGFLDGVMHLEPGQQAGDRKDPAHARLWSGQHKPAALAADLLAVPDKHAKAGTVDKGEASEVSDGTRPRLPPYVTEIRLQCRCN
jgi:hypothetical protein